MRRICLLAILLCTAVAAELLPDGSEFPVWSDTTAYSRTLQVNQRHPAASDANDGTTDAPLLTISRAAELVQAGERVVIHSGVYREMVRPRRGGEGPDRMIAFAAAPGAEVVIKGSRVLESGWKRSDHPEFEEPRRFSKKLWMAALPDELFEDGYYPFRTPNASDAEVDLMPWMAAWKGRVPYTNPRGLLFQDGRRLEQLVSYHDLVRLPGSYWVASDGRTIHVHPFGGGDPGESLFEVATQSHIIKPEKPGLGYIRISGLTLEHCANGFARIGTGALFTMGGHHWIIENNTVRHVNSVAMEIGYEIQEKRDPKRVERADQDLGKTIVRNNRIGDAGTGGIQGHNVTRALVENNDIRNVGWQDAEYYWECAAIKLLINNGTLVRRNHIADIQAAGGIWLDWNNRNSRITRNLIRNVQTAQAAIFIEASQHANLVDNNVIWEIDGQGVRLADTDKTVVAHNLIARTREELVYAKVATKRSLGGRPLTAAGNRVVNNLFLDPRKPLALADGNDAGSNVYAWTGREVFEIGGEAESIAVAAKAAFDPSSLTLSLELDLLPGTGEPLVTTDYFGCSRDVSQSLPGPFATAPRNIGLR